MEPKIYGLLPASTQEALIKARKLGHLEKLVGYQKWDQCPYLGNPLENGAVYRINNTLDPTAAMKESSLLLYTALTELWDECYPQDVCESTTRLVEVALAAAEETD